ncbi:MAG: NAD-dependent epimerase/dehydratase family protein [Planctomycetia bacterium]|nr:NAD-dependent epimerase/dehydratase family protein [Planctomycetia bacterium]
MLKKILIQLDCDPQPSTFDAVVAVDAGADVLLRHGGVTVDNVVSLVHGGMFTRGGADLASTAIFIGGSDVAVAEAVAQRVRETFFGPVRLGVLVDPSGANTTASAAVVAAGRHVTLAHGTAPASRAVVLGGTGPVGQRVARLLALQGAHVTVVSRSKAKADQVVGRIVDRLPAHQSRLEAVEHHGGFLAGSAIARVISEADVIVAAGAAGATLLDAAGRAAASSARVLIDLNAVPPAGIEGIAACDKARAEGAAVVYGALGVGGTKMKIHKAAIGRIFAANDSFLDAEELFAIGEKLERERESSAR